MDNTNKNMSSIREDSKNKDISILKGDIKNKDMSSIRENYTNIYSKDNSKNKNTSILKEENNNISFSKDNNKNLSFIKVGGRRVLKKSNSSHSALKEILDKNKDIFSKSIIDDLSVERSGKIFKYKNNIKIIFDNQKKPIGFLVSGYPDIKTKIITDPPIDFEKAVECLNKEAMAESNELEEYIGIE